jgi:sigma-B regulation protein RsbU (phosphoserine phosphatase)
MAESRVRVLELDSTVFWSDLVALPEVARNMMRCLTERARLTNRLALQAQQERLELAHLRRELDFARQLQASMLPLQQPLFPERGDLEIAALIEPAATVGGDFFDVFLVRDDRLFLCIGDVAGHGIGAALMMARTIGLLRILAMTESTPDELLRRLNERLTEGNETCLFVTLFCGFLDLRSGELLFANGGHCAPLLCGAAGGEAIPLPAGILLGAFEDGAWSCRRLLLERGDRLFLYSDGIVEAEDRDGNPFATAGCVEVLGRQPDAPLRHQLSELRQRLRDFTGRDQLEDDGTMLALRLGPLPAPLSPAR